MHTALLILAGLDTVVLLILAWIVLRADEEVAETDAIGFRYTPDEDPDKDTEDEDGC